MSPMHIGVDMDGIVYNFVDALRQHIHSTTGRPLATMPEPTTWEFYTDNWGLTFEEFIAAYDDAVNNGTMFLEGEPFPDAVRQVNRLTAAGHKVHFVTDRSNAGVPGRAEQRTLTWLANNGFNYTSLTVAKDKTSVPTDVFIEDRPENYLALSRHGVDAWLLDYPYNSHVNTAPGRRVRSLQEFVDAVLVPVPVPA